MRIASVVTVILCLAPSWLEAAALPASVIEAKDRPALKAYLEGCSTDDLVTSLQSVNKATLKAGLECINAATLKVALIHIDGNTLEVGLINIDRPTLRIGLRIIDKQTLKTGLQRVDPPTLKVGLESVDRATLKVALENIDEATLEVALDKIDEATFQVGWGAVNAATQAVMAKYRSPVTLPTPASDQARLQREIEEKLCIGNEGSTTIDTFTFNSSNLTLVFAATINAKHSFGPLIPTVSATFTISGTVNLASPGNSEFCATYPPAFQIVTGITNGCISGEEIAKALAN